MRLFYQDTDVTLYHADVREALAALPDESVQCCVTSPPYWGLRDYGTEGQLGLEPTPEAYVANMVAVFAEVRRVLKSDGVCWVNLGDSYASGGGKQVVQTKNASHGLDGMRQVTPGFAPKQLIGIPWRVAFALRADGWWLRQDIIWSKPNPMPESVTDRCTKAHEYIFMLTKSARYFYDADAIKEPGAAESEARYSRNSSYDGSKPYAMKSGPCGSRKDKQRGHGRRHAGFNDRWDAMEKAEQCAGPVNKRSVWRVATKPYPEAHFATFPPEIPETCILAGSKAGDTILDPFNGSGTTGMVAQHLGRRYVGIDLNADYLKMSLRRLQQPSLLTEATQ